MDVFQEKQQSSGETRIRRKMGNKDIKMKTKPISFLSEQMETWSPGEVRVKVKVFGTRYKTRLMGVKNPKINKQQ